MNTPELTEKTQAYLADLQKLIPDIDSSFLLETALGLTLSLVEKNRAGASFIVTYPDGKSEELRLKVRSNSSNNPGKKRRVKTSSE